MAAITYVGSKKRKRKSFYGRHIVYRVFYGNEVVYVGRTSSQLSYTISAHINGRKGYTFIDILKISKIEYQEHHTYADTMVYMVYYINLYHPILNKNFKTTDKPSFHLLNIGWTRYKPQHWNRWIKEAIASSAQRKQRALEKYLEEQKKNEEV